MTDGVIEYKSDWKFIDSNAKVLETKSQNGITCTWSGQLVNGVNSIKQKWEFDFLTLMKRGVNELHGHIIAGGPAFTEADIVRIDFELTENLQCIEKIIDNLERYVTPSVTFDYYLTPIYTKKIAYDEMFSASDKTDGVLVVAETKFHVNKAFLSFHSDYCTALFSSNFKEGQLTEIPIEDVSYEDFGLLMSAIYPKTVFANDRTAEKLLELGDRFLMPAVTRQVEDHLLEKSSLSNAKLLFIAETYKMPKLMEQTIIAMDTLEKFKRLEKSSEYVKLSEDAKLTLFDRIMQII